MGFFSKKEQDPVCKMTVDPKTAAAKYEWKGKTYYFCSLSCKTGFERNPDQYLSGTGGHTGM